MCPLQFRNDADSDVMAIDQYGTQTAIDPSTGEQIDGRTSDGLYHGVSGVIWSDDQVAMTRGVDKGVSDEELLLCHLAQLMSLCQDGRTLEPHTCSSWLETEGNKTERSFVNLPWSRIPYSWQRVLIQMVDNGKRLMIRLRAEWEIPGYTEAAKLYCREKCELRERIDWEHPDFVQYEAQWS
jgi:hypothetical protein